MQVDERGTVDLLHYLHELGGLLLYYGPHNTPDGTWDELLASDVSVLLSVIAATDSDAVRQEFTTVRNELAWGRAGKRLARSQHSRSSESPAIRPESSESLAMRPESLAELLQPSLEAIDVGWSLV